MKPRLQYEYREMAQVASLAEAWIETYDGQAFRHHVRVASLAEAWIETFAGGGGASTGIVASLAEAWIETPTRSTKTCG